MTDSGICPYCDKEFTVESYGAHLSCPHCKGRVDIFPDPEFYVEMDGKKLMIGRMK
jgi:uncharacterized CHY-type Zn-finger protein